MDNAVYENSLKSHLSTLKTRTDWDVVIKTINISSADLEVLKKLHFKGAHINCDFFYMYLFTENLI